MSPAQVKACSLWEFEAATAGWIEANVPEEEGKISADEEDDLWQGVMDRMG
ncbi:hypothetical protein [Paracoccus sp. (in: a-proteobacteria)]|uniref:hypothetical protein n=1 Tax=Paracoccus sp. TaxID=267 RepID=UPI0028A170A0|nr:hypothetical protein [Paracoccus sp. (in: a-proteobacteria)]